MSNGNLIDTLALTPAIFNDLYYVAQFPPLGEALQIAVDKMNPDEDLLDQIMESGYYSNWKRDTHKEKTLPIVEAYFDVFAQAAGRTIVTEDAHALAKMRALKIQKGLEQLFPEGYVTQQPLYWNYRGLDCKGLLDIVVESVNTVQGFDLKVTSYPLHLFYKQARTLRMDLQQSFYYLGMQHVYTKPVIIPALIPYSTADETLGDPIQLTMVDMNIGANGALYEKTVKLKDSAAITSYTRVFGYNDVFVQDGVLIEKTDLDFLHRTTFQGDYNTGIWF